MSDPIAVLGTGILGRPMAQRLLERGFAVTAWNRTRAKAEAVAGATVAATPAAACAGAAFVLVVVTDDGALESVLLGPAGAAEGMAPGAIALNASTVSPAANRRVAAALTERGLHLLETPVLGSRGEAAGGTLAVITGGDPALIEQAAPVLDALGSRRIHAGEVGAAAAIKLALNQMIAGMTATFSQSLALLERAGVAREPFLEVLRGSALEAPTYTKKLDSTIGPGRYDDPNFPLSHLEKDMGLFLGLAAEAGLEAPVASAVRDLLRRALAAGRGALDYSALHLQVRDDRFEE